MGLKRRLRERAAIVQLARAGGLYEIKGVATTERAALEGLRLAVLEALADGRELNELYGAIAPTGEYRVLTRASALLVAELGPDEVKFSFPTEPAPPGTLLVMTEHDGEPRFQYLQVTDV
jgi:hypothetical protein